MTLGQNIQTARKAKGISQEALAEKIGVSRQALGKWEKDTALPGVDNLQALAKELGVSVDALLGCAAPDTAAPTVTLNALRDLLDARDAEACRRRRGAWLAAAAAAALLLVAVLLWAAGRRREGRFTRLGWLLPGLWALLAVAVAALPVDFAALPPFAWAAERFVPEFPALDHTTQAALLAALSPMLRETCFLAICGLLSALSVLGAFLSARRSLCALTASLGLSLVLSGLPSLLWGLPALTATLLSALGWAVGVGLWLLCLAAKNVFSRVFASSEREKHLYKE